MDYQQSRAYIQEAGKYAIALGLTNIQELMNRLGNPQDQLKYVHVAGTNGKGSVIAYIYTTLQEAGYRTGRYVSPSVYSYRGKMEVCGKPVSREQFAGYVTEVAAVIDEMTSEGLPHPTPFEIETAVAFLFFADMKCDIVVLEVGMGGSTDATNIIRTTEVAVIVPISMEHQGFLGNTLAEIADKKAGIIKKDCSVATIDQKPDALQVIRRHCEALGVELVIGNPQNAEILEESFEGQTFKYEGQVYELSLAGVYQTENAMLALEALKLLDKRGFPTTCQQRYEGLKKTRWDGRLTIIHRDPLFIVDGAHNPAAADMLKRSVRKYFSNRTMYFIMGVFKDKDYSYIINKLCPYAKEIITIETPDNPRALPAGELADAIRPCNSHVRAAGSINEAIEEVFSIAGKDDLILSFGSLSFIGELTECVKNHERKTGR
nr:folylpolyglutamate synthase/dihydrofolate synthase family protein [uncultured Blautia sp.]